MPGRFQTFAIIAAIEPAGGYAVEFLQKIEADVVVLLYCVVLFVSAKNKAQETRKGTYEIYQAVMILVFLDAASTAISLVRNPAGVFFRNAVLYAYYFLNNYTAYLWSKYLYRSIQGDREKIPWVLKLPFFASLLLVLSNPLSHGLFTITAENVYLRGDLFWADFAFCYIYLLHALLFLIANRRWIGNRAVRQLIFLTAPPILGSVVQLLWGGLNLIWICASFSLLVFHLDALDGLIDLDHLTGICNRMKADSFLDSHIRNAGSGNGFSGILIDIDNFKAINDTFGHVVGDEALRTCAKLLQKAVGEDAFLARYGGDEFIILLEGNTPRIPARTAEAIRRCIGEFNKTGGKRYQLSLSMGYAVYDAELCPSQKEFIEEIDGLMYKDKRSGKAEDQSTA
jgi:diguanylate cyclase (GGDEF)-like protein